MSKWIASIVCIMLILGVTGCGGKTNPPAPTTSEVKVDAPVTPPVDAKPAGDVVSVAKQDAAPKPITPPAPAAANANPAAAGPQEAAPAAAPSGPVPKIVCDEPVFDFGEKDSEEKVLHDFIVRNTGDATLEIKNVRTSCGCTVAQPENKSLKPGEQTKIATTLTLKGRQGVTSKTVTVESNDPTNPSFRLELKGTAIAAITIDPRTVSLGRIVDDKPVTQTVSIKATKPDLTFKIESIDASTLKEFTVEQKTVEEGKSYELVLTSNGPLQPGNVNGRIMVRTDSASNPMINISVFAQVIGDIEVAPDTISLQFSEDPAKRSSQYIRVRGGRVPQFKITEVVSPIPEVTSEIKEQNSGDYLIKLMDMPQTEELNGKELLIKTDLASTPEIKIPFKVIKRRPPMMPKAGDLQKMMPQGLKPPVAQPGQPIPAPAAQAVPAEAAPVSAPAPAPAETAPAQPAQK